MVEKLSKAQIAEYKEAFNMFDNDRNGTICSHELGSVMRALGQNPTEDMIRDMIASADKDASGNIDLQEFLSMMCTVQSGKTQEIRMAFKSMDKDGDGFITFGDLKKTMQECDENLSDDDLKRMIIDADLDEDGRVSYTEFVQFFKDRE
ncbi:predicted protein [Nematostella vectensis]|uniref:EF-hand domain-containing protein n=1 Tax=Nematostella vectensis TaxID=45351 RepID=A7RPP0_NEMVE|nr:predicted protein [Nematostella vectensis]|eukprot:XP_001638604.1 predicted protein [Nematostella vectensis]